MFVSLGSYLHKERKSQTMHASHRKNSVSMSDSKELRISKPSPILLYQLFFNRYSRFSNRFSHVEYGRQLLILFWLFQWQSWKGNGRNDVELQWSYFLLFLCVSSNFTFTSFGVCKYSAQCFRQLQPPLIQHGNRFTLTPDLTVHVWMVN